MDLTCVLNTDENEIVESVIKIPEIDDGSASDENDLDFEIAIKYRGKKKFKT